MKEVNILFLIGNGFDINIGLNTRFTDVLKRYLDLKSKNQHIEEFKTNIKNNIELWSSFEEQLGKYTAQFDSEDVNANVSNYRDCITDFIKVMIDYFLQEENRIDYNAMKQDIISVFQYSILEFFNRLDNAPKRIISNMMNQALIKYNVINFNYTCVFDKCHEILKTEGKLSEDKRYGNTVILGSSARYLGEVLHIHGALPDNDLILGVDNIEQIANTEFKRNDKISDVIIKTTANYKLGNSNNETANILINNAQIICIFGISIGSTDKTWWKKIGTTIKNDTNKQLVLFKYIEDFNSPLAIDKIDKIKEIKSEFLSMADIENKDSVENRIHIAINKDMFNLNLVK
ncbi:hypothetical protein PilKf_01676 [Pillotina sp. SPG140]|jgi:hypothetical protein